jgi:hypothetical protein
MKVFSKYLNSSALSKESFWTGLKRAENAWRMRCASVIVCENNYPLVSSLVFMQVENGPSDFRQKEETDLEKSRPNSLNT